MFNCHTSTSSLISYNHLTHVDMLRTIYDTQHARLFYTDDILVILQFYKLYKCNF